MMTWDDNGGRHAIALRSSVPKPNPRALKPSKSPCHDFFAAVSAMTADDPAFRELTSDPGLARIRLPLRNVGVGVRLTASGAVLESSNLIRHLQGTLAIRSRVQDAAVELHNGRH
jgi:hypothetical protein